MSLDVSLISSDNISIGSGIYIRENGSNREITLAEWHERFPNTEPVKIQDDFSNEIYSANITHNLNTMADAAGIYKHLWRPEELNITKAHQLIEPLRAGLTLLKSTSDYFKQFNPSNGWGDYDGLVQFVENYLQACIENPEADVQVSR